MSEKRISVIVPCYNVEQYVDRCLESLIQQTIGIENMEIIAVNDASQDGTLDRLKYYEEKYPESIVLISLEVNGGQAAARNTAMQYVSAPYIGFVDSDDYVHPEMFETMVNAIDTNDCDFVECDWDFFSDINGKYTPSSFELGIPGKYDFSVRSVKDDYISKQLFFTSVWNKVFRKSFLAEIEIWFPEGLRYEDMYFCYIAILYSKSYYYVGGYFYHYFLNPNGTVQQRKKSFQLDIMDVAYSFLQTVKERGLYEEYKDEADWMFMEKYYVYMIWDIWELLQEQTYDYYLEMKKAVKEIVPDYRNNPFRNLSENKMDNIILKLIDMSLSKKEFEEIMDKLWKQQHKE